VVTIEPTITVSDSSTISRLCFCCDGKRQHQWLDN
jgi:hypothetical protein